MLKTIDNGKDLKVVALYPDQKNYYLDQGIRIINTPNRYFFGVISNYNNSVNILINFFEI